MAFTNQNKQSDARITNLMITTDPHYGTSRYTQQTFSIATPAVTTIPINASINDASFMGTTLTYQDDVRQHGELQPQHLVNTGFTIGDTEEAPTSEKQRIGESEQNETMSNSGFKTDNIETASVSDDISKNGKKRSKVSKKSTKLDAKSKLEKSRQSARECRARKKLRYQYLEDLVCNREKAVVKLREELSAIDEGTITEDGKRLLTDQTKENSESSSSM